MNKNRVVISCKNITKNYINTGEEIKILKGISFEIKEGEFVAIMGPSGSGKSTLMHILGALDTATSGDYYLDGQNISDFTEDELADIRMNEIGFVFQAFNLLPRTTVLKNVILPLMYQGVSIKEAEKLAKKSLESAGFDLNKIYNHSNQLSGGQMQRVAIARALINKPSLILADEPTGNLDTRTSEIVLSTFEKINKENGNTIILITHEPDIAAHADRIIVIKDGLIIDDKINKKEKYKD